MSAVETLREAAQLMRERAEGATVALAVADWLDVVVADTTLKCGSYTYPDAGNVPDHALAVARAYLRIEES